MKTINPLHADTVAAIKAGAKTLMNPLTGSIDTAENWAAEGRYETNGLVAVVWDVANGSWVEAASNAAITK